MIFLFLVLTDKQNQEGLDIQKEQNCKRLPKGQNNVRQAKLSLTTQKGGTHCGT